MKIDVKNVLFFYLCCFSVSVCALNSHGTALLSLFRHWTAVPSSVKSSWNASDSTPCSWVGVECDTTHLVTSLNLSGYGYGISGQLGPEIAYLEHLRTIDLSYNAFFGPIPSQLVNCTLLDYLDLSYNTFTGEIPSKIGNLHKLTYISLYANSLTANIPDSLFSIPHLDSIYLFQNRVKSQPDVLVQLEALCDYYGHRRCRYWYRLALPPCLQVIYHVFHISILERYHPDDAYMIQWDSIVLDHYLSFEEEPVTIKDRKTGS
ncbi:Receptor-like protein kinase [Capsicum baccatum]|uniref:Receptor-like protein kinase n=1 Tax=Capsicum baccatum TaxID=33114 RepID=A0A2G2VZG7_CAPBA|nr:Receptor-like protein kinase [Capsicum baccatum]